MIPDFPTGLQRRGARMRYICLVFAFVSRRAKNNLVPLMLCFVCAKIRVDEGLQPMLHHILLVILGLILIGVLTAIFELLGLKNHLYVARILAAACIIALRHTSTGIPHLVAGIDCKWGRLCVAADNEGVPAPIAERSTMGNSQTTLSTAGALTSCGFGTRPA